MELSELVRGLEERCFNAWPTGKTVLLDGWVIRLADGHTRRANSASALYPASRGATDLITLVARLFREAGLTPVFRLTPLSPSGFDAGLAERCWREGDAAYAMYAPRIPNLALPASVTIEARPSKVWLCRAMIAYGHGDPGARALRRMLANLVLPAAFATLWVAGEPVGWGLAVSERGCVGLYDVVVSPEARGRGHGRQLVAALLGWGSAIGAESAYLQVGEANHSARAMYRSFGFHDAYRYTHWSLD